MVWRIREGKIANSKESRYYASTLSHYLSDAATPDHEIRLAEYLTRGAPPQEQTVSREPEAPSAVSIVPPVAAISKRRSDADVARMRREEILTIRRALASDAERVAERLLGVPESYRRAGNQLRYDGGKMVVTVAGPKAGLWHNFAGNEYGKSGGNLLDLAEWKFGGIANAVQWARDHIGLPTPDWSKPQTEDDRKAVASRIESLEKEAAEKRVRDEAEQRRIWEKVAEQSQRRWDAAQPATEHPYLTRKGVSGEGLRIEGKNLLLPLRDHDGKLWSVQTITPDGDKLFPEGGCMHGLFTTIGDVRNSPHVAFAEGYATGRALHDITGFPTVITYNVINKHSVMTEWKRRHPQQALVDAADNDHEKAREPGKRNAGADMAERLRQEIGSLPALPPFKADERGSDWQDYIALHGRARAAEAFSDAVAASRRQATGVAMPGKGIDRGIADVLKITPGRPLNVDEFARILAGRAADGTDLPEAKFSKGREVAYYEFVVSDPKSISVAYALAKTPEERAAIIQAHRNALDGAFKAVIHDITLHQTNGKRGDIAWFDVEHINSRPTVEIANGKETELRDIPVRGDPNLHTHRIVPNIMRTEEGEVFALNSRMMRDRTMEFDSLYQALLASELGRLGIRTALQDSAVEIPSVPKWVREHYSKRDRNARVAAREWAKKEFGADWDALSDKAKLKLVDGAIKEGKRNKAGDFGDFEDWRRQAKEIGYEHRSVMEPGKSWQPSEHRHRLAYERALPLLEKELAGQSVIPASTLRAIAARGLIAAGGAEDWRDVSAVTKLMWREGVQQDGRRTSLAYGRDGEDGVWIFTKLHEDQEQRFMRLAREGARDRSASLPEGLVTQRARSMGLDLSGPHGAAQIAFMEGVSTQGRTAVGFGAAGCGKSTVLAPVVSVHKDYGFTPIGISLANRQASELKGAGIDEVMAVHPFLGRLKEGKISVNDRTLLVVDEIALLGTRQGLELLEAQKRHGFKLIGVGGPEQSQSIEAGSTTDLFVRAFGKDRVPNIDSTIRQHDPEERRIAGLLREGKVQEAIAAKLDRGSAELVPGGREETVERVAADYAAIRRERPGESVAIGTSSHADAHEISEAVRRHLGMSEPMVTIEARQGDDRIRQMPLSAGDKVRLYGRTFGKTPEGRTVHVGDNGHVVEVARANKDGVQFVTKTGELAGVRWTKLAADDGAIRLSYGYAQTTIIVQGATEDNFLAAFLSGSQAVTANAAYVHGSRHRNTSRMYFSDGLERRNIIGKRKVGEAGPITREDIVKNIADNLGKPGDKETVQRFLERVSSIERAVARDFTRQVSHATHITAAELKPDNQQITEGAIRLRERKLPEHVRQHVHTQGMPSHRVVHERGLARKL